MSIFYPDSDPVTSKAAKESLKKRILNAADRHPFLKAAVEFPRAVARIYPYVLWGLILGLACFTAELYVEVIMHWLKLDFLAHPAAVLVEHLGVGFFVSAVAVLLYEWGAHFKEVVTEAHRLTDAVDVSRLAITEKTIASLLNAALDGRELGSEAAAAVSALYQNVERLSSSANWSSKASMRFVLQQVKTASDNAANLAGLNSEVATRRPGEHEHKLSIPQTGRLAADVLTEVMKSIGTGHYLVVSDIDSWNELHEDFLKAQGVAVQRGATIQRIFRVTESAVAHASAVVLTHYALASEWNKAKRGVYEVRCTDATILDRYAADAPALRETPHFGVFVPANADDLAVLFKVTQRDLTLFNVTSIARDAAVISEFRDVWRQLPDPSPESLMAQFLTQEIRSQSVGSSYYVASGFSWWATSLLDEFHREAMHAVETRNLTVKRIFVRLPGEEDEAMCQRVFRKHYEDANSTKGMRGRYEVKVCGLGAATTLGDDQWHFSVFGGSAHGYDESHVLSETVARPALEAIRSHRLSRDRAAKLDQLFQSLPTPELGAMETLAFDVTEDL